MSYFKLPARKGAHYIDWKNSFHLSSRKPADDDTLYEIAIEMSKEELRWYREQLQSVADNMRQVARYANSEASLPPDFDDALANVEQNVARIDELLSEGE